MFGASLCPVDLCPGRAQRTSFVGVSRLTSAIFLIQGAGAIACVAPSFDAPFNADFAALSGLAGLRAARDKV